MITKHELNTPDNLTEREPKSAMIASSATDNCKPLHLLLVIYEMKPDRNRWPTSIRNPAPTAAGAMDGILTVHLYSLQKRKSQIRTNRLDLMDWVFPLNVDDRGECQEGFEFSADEASSSKDPAGIMQQYSLSEKFCDLPRQVGIRRVVFVGGGHIANLHAKIVQSMPGIRLDGIVDRNEKTAEVFAGRWGIPRSFASVEEAVAAGGIDCVHVLTPPDRHAATALPFLRVGIPALVEKPLAVDGAECEVLVGAAKSAGAVLGVNHNPVHHPAFIRLRRAIDERSLGHPTFVDCLFSAPLRQLAARQFGHWMFADPGNILLEAAVHPLSQVVVLAGRAEEIAPLAGKQQEISPGLPFYSSLGLSLRGVRLPAQLRFAVGQSFPFWQISVICEDGVAVADILNNRCFTHRRTRWLHFLDAFASGNLTGGAMLHESLRNAADYVLATARLKLPGDSYVQSMARSIAAFHKTLDNGAPLELDGEFGSELVVTCRRIAETAFAAKRVPARRSAVGARDEKFDIAVLGGTGFIGTKLVERLVADGRRVGVMARHTANLPTVFAAPEVVLIEGDVGREADVRWGIGEARCVVNLAHGGGGSTFPEIETAMVGSATIIASACLMQSVERLIHVGSIAGLYLGPQRQPVTGSTPPDPQPHYRSAYARAKAECDRLLLAMHAETGLPVAILRPGIVVGEGGIAAHSGLGLFNNEQHCIGWNAGRNPLPFVLVEDVAEALRCACIAPGIVGRTYNLVGDVRLSAREYIAELAVALGRPLRFHPKSTTVLWVQELGKWGVKTVLAGERVPLPSRHDLLSRGLSASFDCGDAKRDLGWRPETERERFIERGIRVYATR